MCLPAAVVVVEHDVTPAIPVHTADTPRPPHSDAPRRSASFAAATAPAGFVGSAVVVVANGGVSRHRAHLNVLPALIGPRVVRAEGSFAQRERWGGVAQAPERHAMQYRAVAATAGARALEQTA